MLERVLGERQDRMTDAGTGRRCWDATLVGSRCLNLMVIVGAPGLSSQLHCQLREATSNGKTLAFADELITAPPQPPLLGTF